MNAQMNAPAEPLQIVAVSVASPAEESRHFTPRAKHPVIEMTVAPQTEPVEKILEANFDPVQKALYHIHVTLPIMSRTDTKVINEVLDLVEARFSKIEGQMALELGRLKALAKTDGAVQPASYTNPTSRVMMVYTPEMARWVGLLMRMDEIMRWVDALWYSTRVKSKDRNAVMMNWRNTLTGFSRELNNLHLRANAFQERTAAFETGRQKNPSYVKDAIKEVKRERRADGIAPDNKAKQSNKPAKAKVKPQAQAKPQAKPHDAPQTQAKPQPQATPQATPQAQAKPVVPVAAEAAKEATIATAKPTGSVENIAPVEALAVTA